jgi:putative effector of murein hydrolase LrgA (UPF0299 family)
VVTLKEVKSSAHLADQIMTHIALLFLPEGIGYRTALDELDGTASLLDALQALLLQDSKY